ncbi:MAG: rRNA pseudouridine synthase [Clostridia bacterium]|nr:rRNA pseudouridine synthase [Clostridia bacterium]
MEYRLQKFLAEAGVASRRKAEELILSGQVKVNGKTVTELGTKVNPERDKVYFKDELIKIKKKKIYLLLNKPAGYISAAKDQFDNPSVLHLVENIKERLFPVGRLDKDTTGALLLTNDGDFSYHLTHPKHEVSKTYLAEVVGRPTDEEMRLFMKGVYIDGKKTYPAKIRIVKEIKKNSIVEIVIHEGRNRQVKKMCEEIGHKVVSLQRVAIGNLTIDGLKEGSWRHLTPKEVERLMR